MELKVIPISAHQTHALRHKVLWPHLLTEDDCIIDIDEREDAFHLGVIFQGRIISIASFFFAQSPKIDFASQYRLRAMATDPEFRRMNAGKVLIEEACKILRSKKVDVLWCDARIVALEFYKALGFVIQGEEYEVPLIGPHFFMYRELQS